MSASVLLVSVILAGQVSDENPRYAYPTDGNLQPVDAADLGAAGNPGTSQPPPFTPASPGSSSRRQPDSQPAQITNPYAAPPAGSSTSPPPAAAPPQTSSPFGATSPPTKPNSRQPADEQDIGLKPSEMMRAMLTPPRGSRLTGETYTLADVVHGAANRQEQTERVEAYWDLCSSVADYYLGLREQEELGRLRTLINRVGPSWQQAETELGVRIGTSQRAAVASQYRLASFLGVSDPQRLPLPSDSPHCGDYNTRYDEVFAGRQSIEAEQLKELLPLRYEELNDAASAVSRAEQWVDAVAAQRNANSDGTGMLRSLELLALHRRAFVQIARDYNRRIVRYAELAAPNQLDTQQLVAMLIKTEDRADTATRASTPATSGGGQSRNTSDSQQRTFADQWAPSRGEQSHILRRDTAVEPASAEETQIDTGEERSLLVRPQGQ